jgi:hypothetical protein
MSDSSGVTLGAMDNVRDLLRRLSTLQVDSLPRPTKARRSPALVLRSLITATCLAALAAGCSSSGSGSPASVGTPSQQSTTALARWTKAHDYLAAQTKPTQITCLWFSNAAGAPAPAAKVAQFYDFSARDSWKSHLVTRADPVPKGTFESCEATVPTTVPYSPSSIEDFLKPLGLTFVAHTSRSSSLTPIEIAYAGQDESDPDVIYRDKPGLFGLRIALVPLSDTAFQPGTSEIIQPTDEATASEYLRYAKPLLDWYGYRG